MQMNQSSFAINKEKYLNPNLEVILVETLSSILEGSQILENPGDGGEWDW